MFLYINLYRYFIQKNVMFLVCTVFKKNAMINCKIQSCTIIIINNFEVLQVSIAFFSNTVQSRNMKFFLHINLYRCFTQKNFMFLVHTVFEKNAMLTCKIKSCTIVLMNNFEILQVSIAFFSNTVHLRNIKFFLYINLYRYFIQKNIMCL